MKKINLDNIKTLEDLKTEKNKFYKKNSYFLELKNQIKTANPHKKKEIGKKISDLKKEAERAFAQKKQEILDNAIQAKINNEWIDVTEPVEEFGTIHPLSLIAQLFREWLTQNGYQETTGGEIEEEKYNFENLNIPKNHPSRDLQDTLYIDKKRLLRTHNTSFTARELEKHKNKSFRHFSIGNVFRNDDDDKTHSHQFIQLDIAVVDKVSLSNLIWTLKEMLSYVLEKKIKLRIRPSYFPFTEPSIEIDIFHNNQWIEILGGGMINVEVFKKAGYSKKVQGFAAGIGVERIAMIKYGIDNIRDFYVNDKRFLEKFREEK